MQRTDLDWFAMTARMEPEAMLDALRPAFGAVGGLVTLTAMDGGYSGFRRRGELAIEGVPIGLMAWGGASVRGRVLLSLTGDGCQWVREHGSYGALVQAASRLEAARLNRVDVALTVCDGSITHEMVRAAYAAGKFTTGGRPPKDREITGSNPTDGRTFYVGTRENSPKFLRAYEKGWELAAPFIAAGVDMSGARLILGGVEVDPAMVYRVEIEFKRTNGYELPWDLVERRDEYFAGAYPFTRELLGAEPLTLVYSQADQAQITAQGVEAQIKRQWGRALYTLLRYHRGDISALLDGIIEQQDSPKLLRAGLLVGQAE